MADAQAALREHLLWLLEEGDAHVSFDAAVDRIPPALRGAKPPGLPWTPWQLLEHMRIAVWDIVEYCRKANHKSPSWPDGYWPEDEAPPSDAAWTASVDQFRKSLQALRDMIANPKTDLLAPLHRTEHTLLREALLVADHNAYHLGQLLAVRRALGDWEG
jgi:hypothetical protein